MANIISEPMMLFDAMIKYKADVSLATPAMWGLPCYEQTSGSYFTPSSAPIEQVMTNCKNCGAPLKEKHCDHCNTRYL